MKQWQSKVDDMSAELGRLEFTFSDPEKGFDRSRVKGLVAKLIRVQSKDATTALEVLVWRVLHAIFVTVDTILLATECLPSRDQLVHSVAHFKPNWICWREYFLVQY